MTSVSIVGIDLAKRVFQLHGAAADGSLLFRKQLSRTQLPAFLARQPSCTVAMEACASALYWGREAARLIAPIYVKPFVKRQKNDRADAEAVVEAATRPTMRFVAVRSEGSQALAVVFRTRDLLVRQRTQLSNALRGHRAEFGIVAPQGIAHLGRLRTAIETSGGGVPASVRDIAAMDLEAIARLSEEIAVLEPGTPCAGARR